jgi:hypothetical protein
MEDFIGSAYEATKERLGRFNDDEIRWLADEDDGYENLVFEAGLQAVVLRAESMKDKETLFDTLREDKQAILDALKVTINLTRAGDDITALNYDKDREEVQVHFHNSNSIARRINVAADSGIAMIRDVMKGLEIG